MHKVKSKNNKYINPELCIGWLGQHNESDIQASYHSNILNSRSITYQRETYYQPPTDNQHRTKQNISLPKQNNSELNQSISRHTPSKSSLMEQCTLYHLQ